MFTFQTKKAIVKAILTKRSPYYIQYYINARCNLKCKQCNIVESNSDVDEAPLEDIEVIAANIRKIGGGIVLLTGGEPFLRKDLPEIVEIFRRNKLDVRLQTAGAKVATPEALQRCFDLGARDLNISLDSLDPAKQDYINSVPGTWDSAIKTISLVSNVFKESGICSLGCVLSRYNYAEIPSILEFASEIGWYLSLVPVHITNTEDPMGFRSYDTAFKFEDEDFPELEATIEKLIRMRRDGYKLFDSETFLRSGFNFLKNGKPTWRKNDVCDSPFLYFAVRPNGDMAVCCDHRLPGGTVSLVDPDFAKIYKSKEFQNRVVKVTKACDGCHYGSYPEVTLSVRDPKALLERIKIVRKSVHKQVMPYSHDELKGIIAKIRAKSPELYDKSLHGQKYNSETIRKWETQDGQKDLIRSDKERRVQEHRIRLQATQRRKLRESQE